MCEHFLELLLLCSSIARDSKFELHGTWLDDGDVFVCEGKEDDTSCLCDIDGRSLVRCEEQTFHNGEIWLGFFEDARKIAGDFSKPFVERNVRFCFDREPLRVQKIMRCRCIDNGNTDQSHAGVNTNDAHRDSVAESWDVLQGLFVE